MILNLVTLSIYYHYCYYYYHYYHKNTLYNLLTVIWTCSVIYIAMFPQNVTQWKICLCTELSRKKKNYIYSCVFDPNKAIIFIH